MQKAIYCVLGLVFILGAVVLALYVTPSAHAQVQTAYVRFHVRANSNSEEDQSVKYVVKDALVNYLTPILTTCETVDDAKEKITQEIQNLTNVATQVLQENGFTYGAMVGLYEEYFPTRSYQTTTLESGIYDALIVKLGTGTGDNWWCVLFPPLCLLEAQEEETESINYSFYIKDILDKYL